MFQSIFTSDIVFHVRHLNIQHCIKLTLLLHIVYLYSPYVILSSQFACLAHKCSRSAFLCIQKVAEDEMSVALPCQEPDPSRARHAFQHQLASFQRQISTAFKHNIVYDIVYCIVYYIVYYIIYNMTYDMTYDMSYDI
jgi:hypothetical protein